MFKKFALVLGSALAIFGLGNQAQAVVSEDAAPKIMKINPTSPLYLDQLPALQAEQRDGLMVWHYSHTSHSSHTSHVSHSSHYSHRSG